MTKYLSAVIVVCALAGTAFYQGWPPFSRLEKVENFPTAKARIADIAPELPLAGEVKPSLQVDVKPEIGGKIRRIHVKPGESVKKGDLLVTIDDTDLLNERAAAETEIEGARLTMGKSKGNFDRARQLHERKLLSEEEFVNILADFQIQENGLDKALRRRQTVDDRLSKTRVLAPFDGTVLEIPVSEGQVVVGAASVNSGTNLMTFADLSSLLIISQVNQLDAPKLSLGQELVLKSPDSDKSTASAKVQFIAPLASVKNNIKGFEVRGVIDSNDAQLKPGVSVSVRLALPKSAGVVAVPITAVFEHQGRKVAYVLENGAPVRRDVTVGAIDTDDVEIQSGIREGEEVLLVEPSAKSEKKSRS
ncbi:MAG: efflux RND transporter periplasmic adaptor subunit [Spartobacteria bacterium]